MTILDNKPDLHIAYLKPQTTIALCFIAIISWLIQGCISNPRAQKPTQTSELEYALQPTKQTTKPRQSDSTNHHTTNHANQIPQTTIPQTQAPTYMHTHKHAPNTSSLDSIAAESSEELSPLPSSITAKDILDTQTIKDVHQNITTKKSLDSGYTFVEVYGPNGDMRARLSFKNEILHGTSTAYRNGKIVREIPYKNGQIDGVVITYIAPDKRLESSYKNGKKHGETILYHHDTPVSSKSYNNGMLHGIVKASLDLADSTAYKNTHSITHYYYGKKQGGSTGYANGNIVFKQYYNNGVLQGQTQTYGENAIVKISRNYHNGLLHGEEIVYNYPQETPMYKSSYELDVLISPYENYGANGASYYSMIPKDKSQSVVKRQTTNTNKELWYYENSQQLAMEITKDSGQKRVRTFYTNGVLASHSTITLTQSDSLYYTQEEILESKILRNADVLQKTTWHYTPQGQLLTKSQESPTTTITQSYKNGKLDTEVTTLESEEITIQKGFFPNGALHFEHHYMENTMIQGVLYDIQGNIIHTFSRTNQDMIFDEAFPITASKRRESVLPNH